MKTMLLLLFAYSYDCQIVAELFGDREFLPHDGLITYFRKIACEHEVIREAVCENLIFLLSGFDRKELNEVTCF